jgi:hypothetical protein
MGYVEVSYKNAKVYHIACAMESFSLTDFYKKEYKEACLCRERQIFGEVK